MQKERSEIHYVKPINPEMFRKELNQEEKPILQCKHCGKKNGGHYIMCSAWID